MKEGLIGYIFDGPSNRIKRFFWNIKRKLGFKVEHYGIPVVVSNKIIRDKAILYY